MNVDMELLVRYFLLLILGTCVTIVSCKNEESLNRRNDISNTLTQYTNSESVITGRVLDRLSSPYVLISKYSEKEVKVDSNEFAVRLNHNSPMIVNLAVGVNIQYPIFISPGDSVNLIFYENDLLNEFGRISFSNNKVKENLALTKLNSVLRFDHPNRSHFYNCSEENFIHRLDSLERLSDSIIIEYKVENDNVNKDFLMLSKSYVDYSIAGYLNKYPRKLEYAFRQGKITLSQKYIEKMDAYELDVPCHLNNISFTNYAKYICLSTANDVFSERNRSENGRKFLDLGTHWDVIDSLMTDPNVIEYLKYWALKKEIRLEKYNPNEYMDAFNRSIIDSTFIKYLHYDLEEKVFTGKDYSFQDENGQIRSISELKGRILYIDVWATWCGPCLEQQEYFEALIDSFGIDNSDISFIGLSLDKNVEKWKDMLDKRGMRGIHLIVPDDFNSEFCRDFSVNFIPRFMIVDRNGSFIQPNAVEPSSENLYSYLKELIEEDSFK